MTAKRYCLVLACFALAEVASAQSALTYEEALARARTRAPRILSATAAIEEARGRLLGARVLFPSNPEFEVAAGSRRSAAAGTIDQEYGVRQWFETGGRRGARIAGARADVDRQTASSQNAARELLRDVAIAFWRAVAAQERIRIAELAERIASGLLHTMQQRLEAGDVPVLDVNVSRVSAARTRAELQSAQAELLAALGELRILLGTAPEEQLGVTGDLKFERPYQLGALTSAAMDRPDLRALSAEIRQAEAAVRLGQGLAWPEVALGFSFEKDEGDSVAKGSLAFTLPVFARGQEQRAVSEARAGRLRRELEATKLAIANQVRTAYEVYQRRRNAADELERAAIGRLEENETLARRSFEEGELNIVELLLIRRDSLETRLLHVSQRLDAAIAAVELQARAGVLR